MGMESVKINPNSMESLIKLLGDKTGLRLECYNHNFIEKRIKSRIALSGKQSDLEYFDYIKKNPAEIDKFFNDFTINYTYFFRNNEVFQKVKDFCTLSKINLFHLTSKEKHYLSQLSIHKKIHNSSTSSNSSRKLKIWSCACATGEEPYSLAIMFDQLKKKSPNFPDYEIIASDINNTVINIARRGIYKEFSFKDLTSQEKDMFFSIIPDKKDNKYKIKENISNSVEFIEEDVTKGHVKNNKYDIIFCRNLLIYINKEYRKKFIKILENHLVEGGLLILGKTESISKIKSKFHLLNGINQIYIKNSR